MKKVILLFLVLFASLGVVACGNDATLEWETMPKSVYTVGEITQEAFNTSVKVKINGESVTLADAISKHGATVTGFDLSSEGSRQLVVKFESLTITWDYTVGKPDTNEIEPDTTWYNASNNTFTLNSIEDLYGLAELVNKGTATFAGKTVKLGVDIDLSDKVWIPIGQGARKDNILVTEAAKVNELSAKLRDYNDTTDFKDQTHEYLYLGGYYFAKKSLGQQPTIEYFKSDSGDPEGHSFQGTFDGQGHKIIGLSDIGYTPLDVLVYANSKKMVKGYTFGLFGKVSGNVTIKNIVFEDVSILGVYYSNSGLVRADIDSVGAAVGFAHGTGTLTIDNVKVMSGSITAGNAAAGIVGRMYNTGAKVIQNSENHATILVTGDGTHAGGIAGYTSSGGTLLLHKNTNQGNVTTEQTQSAAALINGTGDITATENRNFGTIKGAYSTNQGKAWYGMINSLSQESQESGYNANNTNSGNVQ